MTNPKISSSPSTPCTRHQRTSRATSCIRPSSRLAISLSSSSNTRTLAILLVGSCSLPYLPSSANRDPACPFSSLSLSSPGQMSDSDLQQAMQYQRTIHMIPTNQHFASPPGVFPAGSPPHGQLPLSASPPPQSPNMYDPLSPPISGSDTSGDGIYHSRNSSATGSPSSSRANSLVHRHPLRYNPTPSPTSSSAGRRSRGQSISDDDEGMGVNVAESLANTRKEATRRQRIEAEQRRRDELRDGYARLKDVLPVSNQKSSKVSLLERGAFQNGGAQLAPF